MLEKQ